MHCDLKPDNVMLKGNAAGGLSEMNIFLIDFGLSRKFRDPKTGYVYPPKRAEEFFGNIELSSVY